MKNSSHLLKAVIMLCIILNLTSCRELAPESEVITRNEVVAGHSEAEVAYPGETGIHKRGTFFGKEITYTEIDGKAVFEGDIILSREQLGKSDNARTESLTMLSGIWRNNTIPYTIDASVTNKDAVLAAIAEVEASTTLRFKEHFQRAPLPGFPVIRQNYVTFTRARGYSSSIGMVGGEQFITVPPTATKGGILHEIGHTVGLYHEHTRPDRNSYVNINSNNVAEANLPNVGKFSDNTQDPLPYGTFDFGSMMMMDSWAYSKNGLPVMTTKDGKTFNVQRDHLSKNDIDGIIAMYSNVFAGMDDDIYLGDTTTGKMAPRVGYIPGTKKMFAVQDFMCVADKSMLFQLDSKSASGGYPIAYSFPNTKGITYANKSFYVLQNGYIWKFEVPYFNDSKTTIGGQNWLAATAITYAYGFLCIVSGNNLFRVSMNGQSFVSLGTGYQGVTEVVTLKDKIYFMKPDGKLYKVDPMTGAANLHTANIFGTNAQLTSNGKNLLVTSGNTLYNVGQNGTAKVISSGWAGVTELAAIDPANK